MRLWCGLLLGALLPLQAATYHLIVAGLGGEPEYEARFAQLAQEAEKALRTSGPDAHVVALQGPAATKARVQAALAEVASQARATDSLVLVLIGHGTDDGQEYKFNLPGPDLSGGELAELLNRVPAQRQLVVNTTSASGGCTAALRRPNRIVVTATKTGSEKNVTLFARYWVEALQDPASDTDKNESVSALEAFRYAEAKTKKFYETQKRLATEHPQLADATARDDGANRFVVLRTGSAQVAARTPEKARLLVRREELERRIDDLKGRKAAMPTEQYRRELSQVLLDLAKLQAEIDK